MSVGFTVGISVRGLWVGMIKLLLELAVGSAEGALLRDFVGCLL